MGCRDRALICCPRRRNLYWLARYLERAENTARLVRSYNHLIMDIPKGSEPPWMILIDILDAREAFEERYQQHSEMNVHKFLVTGDSATSSIRFAINCARDNLRITRDALPESLGASQRTAAFC